MEPNTFAAKTAPCHEEQMLWLDPANVCCTLRRFNLGKAAGPDKIAAYRTTDACPYIDKFNISLCQAVVPPCYKASAIILVPKKSTVSALSRTIALTPIITKWRLGQRSLLPSKPLQLALCTFHCTPPQPRTSGKEEHTGPDAVCEF